MRLFIGLIVCYVYTVCVISICIYDNAIVITNKSILNIDTEMYTCTGVR